MRNPRRLDNYPDQKVDRSEDSLKWGAFCVGWKTICDNCGTTLSNHYENQLLTEMREKGWGRVYRPETSTLGHLIFCGDCIREGNILSGNYNEDMREYYRGSR